MRRRLTARAPAAMLGALLGLAIVSAPTASAASLSRAVPGSSIGRLLDRSSASATTPNGAFGSSVAVSGTTAIVGAPGVNSSAGAADVYVKGTSGWPTTPTATLQGATATANDRFGSSVAVSATTAIVGAPGASSNSGAAYIYVKGTSGWPTTPTATLLDPGATAGGAFGSSVAVSGTTAIVGAWHVNRAAGAAYIYVKGASGWPTTQTVALHHPTGARRFGSAVAVSGTTAFVGAPYTNTKAFWAGSAYAYVKGASGWLASATATLQDPTATADDFFGTSVAVSGTTAIIGALDTALSARAAYAYANGASGWPTTPTAVLQDPTATAGDNFAFAVAVSGTTAIVGAPATNSNSGAAYVYVKGASGWPTAPTATLQD